MFALIVSHLRNKINYPKIINYSSFEFCFIHQLDSKLVSKLFFSWLEFAKDFTYFTWDGMLCIQTFKVTKLWMNLKYKTLRLQDFSQTLFLLKCKLIEENFNENFFNDWIFSFWFLLINWSKGDIFIILITLFYTLKTFY
jgi:hypothetical protein